jgi:hypothetical protein
VLEDLIGQEIVVDLRSQYVCLGTLMSIHELYLELKNADLHDLRDTDTTREQYVVESSETGIKRNRRWLLVVRNDVVALSRLADVVCE